MNKSQRFWRGLFFILMIAALCGGLALPVTQNIPAHAAPQMRASANIVISEFRTRGPGSASNEFIELHNISSSTVPLDGWQINYSSSSGGTPSNIYDFLAGSSLGAGEYFLLANSGGYSGSVTPDDTYTTNLADNGGIAILNASNVIIDQVGMSSGSAYKEATILTPMSADNEQSYERRLAGNNCNDTDNNAADFFLNASSSNPQNSSSAPVLCLGVTNVTSSVSDATPFIAGDTIDIEITFSMAVDVIGGPPTLLLETGVTDRTATYMSGSGTDTLIFNYTIMAGDASADLDYASSNALSLNGGSIVGPPGDAVLTLPSPGSGSPGSGSLGVNKNIVIDNGSNPTVGSITRQNPPVELTNADTLVFRVMFSEVVVNVDTSDFVVTGGTTATPTAVTPSSGSVYDVTVSAGDLTTFNGIVGLGLNAAPPQNIEDASGNALSTATPSPNETYTLDNNPPSVTINLASGQAATTDVLPVNFTVVFSQAINVTSFVVGDITQTGTATGVTWRVTDTGDHQTFNLSATSLASNGTVAPSIAADRVTDPAGNGNSLSTGSNTVNFSDTTRPTVTVNQASGQNDPATTLPVRFTVVFSETINTGDFAASDITQNGTATGITWSITNPSGDRRTFTLSATAITVAGTLIPSIAANRVRDLVGNSNLVSTSTDNTVTFNSTGSPSVVISEFRTRGPNGSNDEFIELYNPTANYVDISGWKISSSNETGTPTTQATIPASTILRPGQHYLIANTNSSGGFSGSITVDLRYTRGIADGGGIALMRGSTIIDAVGMSTGSRYREGATLAPLTGSANQSYERLLGGISDSCQDTNDNVSDFTNITPSDPQNSATTPLRRCGVITVSSLGTTRTTITAHNPNPSVIKASVKVSVRVAGVSTTLAPLGTRVNISGATGTGVDCTITLNAAGTGSCNVTFTSTGTKTITATYLGDNTHRSSKASISHSVVVNTPTPFRTRTPTPRPPSPLVGINEFVPRPGHDWNNDGVINTGDEYIELINHGVIDVNLSGYTLDDEVNIGSEPFRLPSVTIKPGERIVFYGTQTGLLLGDGGDGVRLLKSNGQLVDAYNYSVVRFPDESYCRLPDNGGLDDWNEFCFPTPGLQNSQSQSSVNPPTSGDEAACPISDTLPEPFVFAECQLFGKNIWNRAYWDQNGWFDEKNLPAGPGKSPPFAD